MIKDYFFNDYIVTTYQDHKRNVYKVEIYDKTDGKNYMTTDEKEIKKIIEIIK